MKRIALPAVMASAILLASALVVIPLNVNAGSTTQGDLFLALECDEVDKTISAKLVFYFTIDGNPVTNTLTVLECDKK
jgi:hypothetical protein